ncbi:SAM-dependent methyltransferase, partial [Patescibacteria group bacterium]|nr:SAM-dependent methyltransferase [Patescibacteria group bacterium]
MSIFFSIFFISFSLLSYEILLMRTLSITSWSHFAYMVISIALLGFGASGSFISLFKNIIKKHFNLFFLLFSFLFPISIFLCSFFSQFIQFEPLLIVWYHKQYLYLLEYYLVLFIPFFLGASCIGIAFFQFNRLIPRLYFFNLLGSAAGALGTVLLMYIFSPVNLLPLLTIFGFLAAVIFSLSLKRKIFGTVFLASFCLGTIFYLYPPQLHISQYKSLSTSLNLPRASILKEKFSPLGLINILKSPAIRCAPGLSFNFKGDIPPQLGLFTDADSISAINYFDGDLSSLNYLDYTTTSLPYHLTETPRVLIIGSGGGSGILNALYHKAVQVDAVEVNPQIVDLVNREYGDFSGQVYSLPGVRAVIAEGRGFIESTSKRYDLIDVSLLDSFSASSAGVYALSENYLYTVEALMSFLKVLTPQGVLSITRWVKIPPRDGIKVFASAVEALERIGVKSPSSHLIFIRSWSTCTLLVSRSPFTPVQIRQAEEFSQKRSFDLIWTSDINLKKVNQYNILP